MRAFAAESGAEPFRFAVERRGGSCLITVRGEFDMRCARRLESLVESLGDIAGACIVLDVAKVTFIDSSGVRTILALEARSRREGFDFAIIPGRGQVERVFRVTGLERGVRLVEGLDEALQDAGGGTRTPTGLKPTSS